MEPIQKLELRGVTRRFGGAAALHDFNLDIAGGSFVTLLGPSGCGKSTALNCLAGLLELSEGEIIMNGKAIQNIPAEKRGFGMVFQNYALFPHLTVARNVAYGLEIRRVAKAEVQQRVGRALELVQLGEFGKRFPAQLSGGQQQRLAIARTIVLEPSLLLLDEPLSNLDAKLRNEMRFEIKQLHNKLNLTTVYVTHDQSEAMSLSDLVVVMRRGKIEQRGTPGEIYNRPASLYVADFMGYSNRLPVEVLGWEGKQVLVRTSAGKTLRTTPVEGANWQAGNPAIVCFRPEDARASLQPGFNPLGGQVVLSEYMGKSFEVLVNLADDPNTRLQVHSQTAPDNGSMLEFGIEPERILLFPPSEEETASLRATGFVPQPAAMKGER